ncbi:methylamine utilization protein [Pseudomonas turukhanskensis]|uniref:Methylamine utilization protein n=1 Tax=Pseudomonas turukhanskensis TaxID=1806536 RepID=A0A9W6NEX7_9PSED|nr:methylamine utilization protein [Pseudomonas turukhanskensis]GLK88195.1 methylamine utilization protein [Pseudomonas turukhanskensis]
MPVSLRLRLLVSLAVCVVFTSCSVGAAQFQAKMVDAQGKPIEGAVVTLQGPIGAEMPAQTAIMDQVQKQFAPQVLAVHTSTKVTFPNSDNIRHHVYSFSPAKRFELRLYEGTPSEPITFDKPGVVVLGCNIHDWMVGYIYVTDDPWFATSDASGVATLQLPAGKYNVTLWHPKSPDLLPQKGGELTLSDQGASQQYVVNVTEDAEERAEVYAPKPSAFGDAFKKAASETKQ